MANKVYGARDANGKLVQKRFSSAKMAREWQKEQAEMRKRIQEGLELPLDQKDLIFQEFSAWFVAGRRSGTIFLPSQKKPATRGHWEQEVQRLEDYILPKVGKLKMRVILTQKWQEVLDDAQNNPVGKNPLSNATYNRMRAMLHFMYKVAIHKRWAGFNPIDDVVKKDEGDAMTKSDYWSTPEECQKFLLGAAELGARPYCLFTFLINDGRRIGENCALQHKDIRLSEKRIHFCKIVDWHDDGKVVLRTKSGGAMLGMNDAMVEAYRWLLSETEFNKPTDFLFASLSFSNKGLPWNQSYITKLKNQICEKKSLRKIRLHDLRHTFASHFIMNGGTIYDLKAQLGHSDTKMIEERYGHLSPEHIAKQANVVQMAVPLPKDKKKVIPMKR